MKISSVVVRRLRTARGWSQDQLATASGVSLRTIQRVEAEGSASRETRVSLAATFNVPLAELNAESGDKHHGQRHQAWLTGMLLAGLAIITCAAVSESGRFPGVPMSDAFAVLDALIGIAGLLLALPAIFHLVAKGHYASVALTVLGTPLAVMLVAAVAVGVLQGHTPIWPTIGMGVCGVALLLMAFRTMVQPRRSAHPSDPCRV